LDYNTSQMNLVETDVLRPVVSILALALLYGFSFWRIFKENAGNRVVECGTIALMVFVVLMALAKAKFPTWILGWLAMLVFWLCILTMFFLAQQGYRALRRRNTT
jgi:hypothetical protein